MALSALLVGVFALPTLLNRDKAMALSRFWAQTLAWGLHHIGGISRTIEGAEHLPNGPAIIACKHQSMWETIVFAATLPHPCFILKKELRQIPVFGWWCAASGFVFVDRSAGASALKTMLKGAAEAIEKGSTHIIIFPEGTRTPVGETGDYQPGVAALAKALNIPVIPAAHNSGQHWRQRDGEMIPGNVTLKYGRPLPDGLDRKELMARLKSTIEPMTRSLEAEHSVPTSATTPETI